MDRVKSPYRHSLAIEIDDSAVRLAQLNRRGTSLELVSWNVVDLPNGSIVNGVPQKPDVIAAAIRRAIQTVSGSKLSTKYVGSIIPEVHAFMTAVRLKNPTVPTLETIQPEIFQHLPYPQDEVQLDWKEISHDKNESLITVGAIPKQIINSYLTIFHQTKLVPILLEAESTAIARSVLSPSDQGHTVLVLDLGKNLTTAFIVENGAVRFSSSSAQFSGAELTSIIGSRLHLTSQQAEKAKRLFGLLVQHGKGEVRRALLPSSDQLVKRLEHIEEYATNLLANPTKRITEIVLTGGGSALLGLPELLQTELRLPVSLPLPLEIHRIKQQRVTLSDDQQRSGTAVLGTALYLAT